MLVIWAHNVRLKWIYALRAFKWAHSEGLTPHVAQDMCPSRNHIICPKKPQKRAQKLPKIGHKCTRKANFHCVGQKSQFCGHLAPKCYRPIWNHSVRAFNWAYFETLTPHVPQDMAHSRTPTNVPKPPQKKGLKKPSIFYVVQFSKNHISVQVFFHPRVTIH